MSVKRVSTVLQPNEVLNKNSEREWREYSLPPPHLFTITLRKPSKFPKLPQVYLIGESLLTILALFTYPFQFSDQAIKLHL